MPLEDKLKDVANFPAQSYTADGLLEAMRRADSDPIDSAALTTERKSTHGDWMAQSALAQSFKRLAREGTGWKSMQPYQREAVEMVLVKLSRICSGDPSEPDHWNDLAGYSHLGKGGHT